MNTAGLLGDIIYQARMDLDLTQDEYGRRHGVSGPAIFKFEKGYVNPSLALWLRIAEDCGVPERRAVLLWLKSKLPEPYRKYVEIPDPDAAMPRMTAEGKPDYASFEDPEAMKSHTLKDKDLPKGLRDLLDDDELWKLYRPVGHEINLLRELFSPLGKGSKKDYADALRLIREFTHSF